MVEIMHWFLVNILSLSHLEIFWEKKKEERKRKWHFVGVSEVGGRAPWLIAITPFRVSPLEIKPNILFTVYKTAPRYIIYYTVPTA